MRDMKNLDMKNIMKEAHKMTREIKSKYENINYKFQLGLCISFIIKNMKEGKKMIGTEKQIKYAQDLKDQLNKIMNSGLKIIEFAYETKKAEKIKEAGEISEKFENIWALRKSNFQDITDFFMNMESAKDVINCFKSYRFLKITSIKEESFLFEQLFKDYKDFTGNEIPNRLLVIFQGRNLFELLRGNEEVGKIEW